MSSLPQKQVIPASVSLNFSVAKVFAIFLVVAGHWFTGTILWVPVTMGLFVFAFSSAYFTSRIYGARLDTQQFWRQKLRRLGVGYWITLAFLVLVVLLKGGAILHWHSLVHFAGLSGLLNWFAIQNRSGLGAGLWFFTLLLGFYIVYPYLAKISSSRRIAGLMAAMATGLAVYLEENVKVGHELWLTTLGFILGAAVGFHEVKISPRWAFTWAAGSCLVLLGTNVLTSFKGANTALICLSSILVSIWLTKAKIPESRPFVLIAKLEKYLLEIFLTHTYLFVRLTGNSLVDFVFSLVLIVFISAILHTIIAFAIARIFVTKPLPPSANSSQPASIMTEGGSD